MNDVILIGGMPAGGKTTLAKLYTDRGYVRLNRDTVGGNVNDLLPAMKKAIEAGENVVMDNLYATKASRAETIKLAKELKAPISFYLMDTSLEDAQFNACVRMINRCGRLLYPDDHKKPEYKDDPNLFPVAVLYKYRKEFEEPSKEEGFDYVSKTRFMREYPKDWVNKAVIYDFDGTLRTHDGPEKFPTKPSQVRAIKGRHEVVKAYEAKGYMSLGASNQSGVAKGILTCQDVEDCLNETLKQLGLEMKSVLYCPHKVPPITCYCRKPGPGMLVQLIVKYKLDPRQCIFVGDMKTDETCAKRAGMKFVHESEFFSNTDSKNLPF